MRTACAMHSALITGSMPGIAASTSETWLLGSAPNSVAAPENSFEREATCACTSRPTMTSHSPVAPSIKFLLLVALAVFWAVSCMEVLLRAPSLSQGAARGKRGA